MIVLLIASNLSPATVPAVSSEHRLPDLESFTRSKDRIFELALLNVQIAQIECSD